MQTTFSSSQAFIKALKSSSDPPQQGGPLKIALAEGAWQSETFQFPNKDEVIVEWILASFSREKTNSSGPGYVTQARYWRLLEDVLYHSQSERSSSTRSLGAWLNPLLSRIHFVPIVTTWMRLCVDKDLTGDFISSFNRCFLVLWAHNSGKTNLDNLTDAFGALLPFITAHELRANTSHQGLEDVFLTIVTAFHKSLQGASNSRKVFTTFTQDLLSQWIRCIPCRVWAGVLNEQDESGTGPNLWSSLVLVGMDILYSIDSIKGVQDFIPTYLSKTFGSQTELPISQLCALPVLFQSFVRTIQKHKLAIFSQGSSTTQSNDQALSASVKECAAKGFDSCYDIITQWGDKPEVWRCALLLVETLHKLQIVGYGDRNKVAALSTMASWATSALANKKDSDPGKKDSAVQILSAISRIDFEVVTPYVKTILACLLTSPANAANQELLRIHLDYHSKTRTLVAYMEPFLACFSELNKSSAESVDEARQVYILGTNGALFAPAHVEDLRKSMKAYLTFTQIPGVVRVLCEALYCAWQSVEAECKGEKKDVDDYDERKKKRPKVDPFTGDTGAPVASYSAVSFSLISRLASIVLPTLATHSLDERTAEGLQGSIRKTWDLVIRPSIKLSVQPGRKLWSSEMSCAAGLGLHHALSFNASLLCPPCEEDLWAEVLGLVTNAESLPELKLECVRFFFDRRLDSVDSPTRSTLISELLACLRPLKQRIDHASWKARSSYLSGADSDVQVQSAIAILHLAMDRWLLDLNEYSTPDQLNELAELCLTALSPFTSNEHGTITPVWITKRFLRLAIFWELENCRDSFLFVADKMLKFVDEIDVTEVTNVFLASPSKKPSNKRLRKFLSEEHVRCIGGVYKFLLSSPKEYIPKHQRTTFLRRALVADVVIWSDISGRHELEGLYTKISSWIRSWVADITEGQGGTNMLGISDNILDIILTADGCTKSRTPRYENATLNLAEVLFKQILGQAQHGDENALIQCCSTLWKFLHTEVGSRSIVGPVLRQFVQSILSESPSSGKLSESARSSIRGLQQNIQELYLTKVRGTVQTENVLAWRSCLVLHRWLGVTNLGGQIVLLGQTLLRSAQNSGASTVHLKHVFGLLCDELFILEPVDRRSQLMLISVSFVTMFNRMTLSDLDEVDNTIKELVKNISLDDYAFVLDVLREALIMGGRPNVELRALVHFSRSFTRFAPQGHTRYTQDHLNHLLRLFVDQSVFTGGDPDLCQEVLDTIDSTCSVRAHVLRQIDLSLIWSILAKTLSPSQNPNALLSTHPKTHTKILHLTCSITGTIIRLRRDLVAWTVPHLGIILRQLLSALKRPRTQLGSRQLRLVAGSLPWWISPTEPCGIEEARAVARVLTSLEAKTIPKVFSSRTRDADASDPKITSNASQKAESLTQPFSKHAAYVLQAYLVGETDALCTYPLVLRRELEPGLFVLCGMMNDHSRDALMVQSLDAAGKVAMKVLWKAYRKQKYVGGG